MLRFVELRRCAWVVLLVLVAAVLPFASLAEGKARVTVSGSIVEDTVWTSDEVVVVAEDVTVVPGVTLTIEPGTIVKFAQYADLIVNGSLQVGPPLVLRQLYLPMVTKGFSVGAGSLSLAPRQATISADEPRVYFTSLKDDSLGGDTNGDGDETTPAVGDWGGLVFTKTSRDYTNEMRHFQIDYSGQSRTGRNVGAILLENGSPYLNDAAFGDNYLDGIEIQRIDWLNDSWSTRGIAYHVTGDLTVASANTLNIGPGVVVKFADAKQLVVEGTLEVHGTSSNPVLFTSIHDDTAAGDTNGDGDATGPDVKDWGGIRFAAQTQAVPGSVTDAEIRYTGQSIFPNVAAIELENVSPELERITFVDNYLNGAQIVAPSDELDSLTLASQTVPYIVLDDLYVPLNETLTVGAGATLKFTLNKSLHVQGSLQAVGTQAAPITLTSLKDDSAVNDTNNDGSRTTPEAGNWGCVYFDDTSVDAQCTLDWVVLRYGGRDGLDFGSTIGAIFLGNASPTLTNIAFYDNLLNAAQIASGDWLTGVWTSQDVVYFVGGDVRIPTGEIVTLGPGTTLKVANPTAPTTAPGITVEGGLRIGDAAGAIAVITSGRDDTEGPAMGDNRDSNGDGTTTFAAVGNWMGITFASSADIANSYVMNARIKYGGLKKSTFVDRHGAIRVEGVNLSIAGCDFVGNATGVEAIEGAAPIISTCSFQNHVQYAVYNDAPDSSTVSAENNWWDSATGPRSDGEACNTAVGSGEMVSCGVSFSPWLAMAP